MKASSIHSFFSGETSARELSDEIDEDVESCASSFQIKGGSAPVFVTGNINLKIGYEEIRRLCDGFLGNCFNISKVNYIGNALQMMEGVHFENENVRDLLDLLSDDTEEELEKEEVEKIKAATINESTT